MFNIPHLASLSDGSTTVPPPPVAPEFPPCPDYSSRDMVAPRLAHLENLFRIKHIKLLTPEHLRHLNFQVRNDGTVEDLVPLDYLPPIDWQDKPVSANQDGEHTGPSSSQMLSNGAAVPGHEAFYNRIVELAQSNEDAYAALDRRPTPNKNVIRLAQFRRFWTELKNVGMFWDASKDNLDYDDPEVQRILEQQKEERISMRSNSNTKSGQGLGSPRNALQHSQSPSTPFSSHSKLSHEPKKDLASPEPGSQPLEAAGSPSLIYSGHRRGVGSDMPSKHRDDLVRTFFEPIAWSFGCVIERTVSQPYLHVGSTRLIADHAMRVFRGPQDRQRSRARIVEGPLMALQCTHETRFPAAGSGDVDYLARELGALLVIAQERDREGKVEVSPGTGQWWANARRWGGGTGEVMGIPLLEDDGTEPVAEAGPSTNRADRSEKASRQSPRSVKRLMKKQTIARSHNPPSPSWEKRVDYKRIGKDPDDPFDTIYMVSCLNHHMAIVKLRVHSNFLALLDRARTTHIPISDAAWYGLHLVRSKWYNLFEVDDRVEMMRGLWGIMGWLMRDVDGLGSSSDSANMSQDERYASGAMDTTNDEQ